MKRFSNLIGRNKGSDANNTERSYSTTDLNNATADSVEGKAARAIRDFCESGDSVNRDEEVLHLPTIVDAAEASTNAATACALQIRSYLHKSWLSKPHAQYNAIMLIRILSDHPGAIFTRNFDDKWVKTVKTLLRESKDKSVQQLLRETLDSLEANRFSDPGVQGLITMWIREKGLAMRYGPPAQVPSQFPPVPQNRPQPRTKLPPPDLLASEVAKARNTAKLLLQFLQTTPAEEVGSNELIKEFSDRCLQEQRYTQNYISCDDPAPDDDTLQTLIETNEQLSLAYSRYQRAILAGRRAVAPSPSTLAYPDRGSSVSPLPQAAVPISQAPQHSLPPQLPQTVPFSSFGNSTSYDKEYGAHGSIVSPVSPPRSYVQPVNTYARRDEEEDDLYDSPTATRAPLANNPFADPLEEPTSSVYSQQHSGAASAVADDPSGHARPSPAPWHNSNITPSFLGRQESAVGGITMHAPGAPTPSEIDGHSGVGRTDYRDVPGRPEPQTSFTVTSAPVLSSNKV